MRLQRIFVQKCTQAKGTCLVLECNDFDPNGHSARIDIHLYLKFPFTRWFLRRMARANAKTHNALFIEDQDWHADVEGKDGWLEPKRV